MGGYFVSFFISMKQSQISGNDIIQMHRNTTLFFNNRIFRIFHRLEAVFNQPDFVSVEMMKRLKMLYEFAVHDKNE